MNIPHDKFCVLPWVSIEASPIGTVRPCCLADDEILDNTGNKFEFPVLPNRLRSIYGTLTQEC